jgi:hypothetical protein
MYNFLKTIFLFSCLSFFSSDIFASASPQRQYYVIRIYHIVNQQQISVVDQYLQNAFLPALHRAGVEKVGVFHLIGNDTASDKRVFVLYNLKTLDKVEQVQNQLDKDKTFETTSKEFWNIAYDKAPYSRFETIILHAFEDMPLLEEPKLSNPRNERVYELRSYESATEGLGRNKINMFNKGGEIKLFKSLNFNAVFYAEVVAGCKMPNLMYMTCFENKAAREEHWKSFSNDPIWKNLSAMPVYQHNVSKADIFFLMPTEYSDF